MHKRSYSSLGPAAHGSYYSKKQRPAPKSRFGAKGRSSRAGYIARIAQQVVDRNVEWKFFDATFSATVDNAGTATCLSLIPQGDTSESRDGDHLRATSIRVNDVYAGVTQANNVGTLLRVLYIQWQGDTTDAPPTVAGVLEDTAAFSFLQHDNRGRMHILSDKMFVLDDVNVLTSSFTAKLPIPTKGIQYTGTTTQHRNGVWRILLSNQAAGATAPTVSSRTRINFSDA